MTCPTSAYSLAGSKVTLSASFSMDLFNACSLVLALAFMSG